MNSTDGIKAAIVLNLWMILLIFTNLLCKTYIDSISDTCHDIGIILYIATAIVNIALIISQITKPKSDNKVKSSV